MAAPDDVLFDYVLVIKLQDFKPVVSYRFPPSKTEDPMAGVISQFAFPEEDDIGKGKVEKNSNRSDGETFSFTLTEGDGSKRFGYCSRFLVNEKGELTPECYVILSLLPCASLFYKLLEIVGERRRISSSAVFTFLKSVLAHSFPKPGQSFTVKTFSASKTTTGMDEYTLTRPSNDFLLEFVSYGPLVKCCNVAMIVTLFEAMLLERRIIICASHISHLSMVVNAVSALVYPFTWQHIFIPILPKSLLDYCSAPMPFLVGMLSTSLDRLGRMPMEEVLLLDVDKKKFTKELSDEPMLPKQIVNRLRTDLEAVVKSGRKDKTLDLAVSKVLLGALNDLFGHYPTVMKKEIVNGKTVYGFDRKALLTGAPKAYQKFIDEVGASQMFEMWVRERQAVAAEGKTADDVLLQEDLIRDTDENKLCKKCNLYIDEPQKKVKLRADMWHLECFVCKHCNKQLDPLQEFVRTAEQPPVVKVYCMTCHNKKGSRFWNKKKKATTAETTKADEEEGKPAAAASNVKQIQHRLSAQPAPTPASQPTRPPARINRTDSPPIILPASKPRSVSSNDGGSSNNDLPSGGGSTKTNGDASSNSVSSKSEVSSGGGPIVEVTSSKGGSSKAKSANSSNHSEASSGDYSGAWKGGAAKSGESNSTNSSASSKAGGEVANSGPSKGGSLKAKSATSPNRSEARSGDYSGVVSNAQEKEKKQTSSPQTKSTLAPPGKSTSTSSSSTSSATSSSSPSSSLRPSSPSPKPSPVASPRPSRLSPKPSPSPSPPPVTAKDHPSDSQSSSSSAPSAVCDACSKPLSGTCVKVHGKSLHANCFICAECKNPLQKGFVKRDATYLCRSCGQTRPNDALSRPCTACGKSLSSSPDGVSDGRQEVVTANNQSYHPSCFRCEHCNKAFDDSTYQSYEGKFYHPDCFANHIRPKCVSCGNGLSGKCLNIRGQRYHDGCFVCTKCSKTLGGGYVIKGTHPFCKSCALSD